MAQSPDRNAEGVVRVVVKSGGTRVAEGVVLVSADVRYAVNAIPSVRLVFDDGDIADQDFPLSNEALFKPGAAVSVSAGYGDDEEQIFSGIVVKHGIRIAGENRARLIVECRDKAVKMTIGRRNANFIDQKDSDIISKLIGAHDLTPDVQATDSSFKELVQFGCSDWDFVLARAEVNGYLAVVEDAKVSVRAPKTDGSARLKVSYGVELMEFHADIDARTQLTSVASVAWDPKTQRVVKGTAAAPQTLNAQGDLTGAVLAQVASPAELTLRTTVPLERAVLGTWAKAQQVKAGLARIRGRMKFQGSAQAKIGELIELAGVGNRFNGSVYVTAVRHDLSDGNWTTEVEFGLAPDWFVERPDVAAPPASAWTPAVNGLQIGVVQKLDADPQGEYRVQVSVPVTESEQNTVWARLAKFYGSNTFGAFFIPEIDDEVVLGYLNNDPSHPVILASVYSSNHKPPYELTAKNNIKAIVTRCKSKIEFDDEKKIITVQTPAGNKIVLSDEDKSILLQDQNSNRIKLNPGGIVVESPKDIRISAKGTIAIDAVGAISVTSKADVKTEGLNVANQAQVGFSAKGNATAELVASGQTVVKGALVLIN